MQIVNEFLERNKNKHLFIHIIGDAMVDEYYNTKVTRISPESPNVCVMVSDTETPEIVLPGGAANVCYQLNNFNVWPRLFSFVDSIAYQQYRQAGLKWFGIVSLDDYEAANSGWHAVVPRKKRFFDGDIQVGDRWDVERLNLGLTDDQFRELHKNLDVLLSIHQGEPHVIILSDYNKGMFRDWHPTLPHGIPTIVDPKKAPIDRWAGCTVFKPNSVEAIELSGGLTNWKAQCDFFYRRLNCESVVITQQGTGVVGFNKDSGYFEYRPVKMTSAKKPIGAGDCFVGILAMAIGHGFPIAQAAQIAFEAGALYVERDGKGSITPWSLQRRSKLANPQDLAVRDYKLVFTNGCFDILHTGHLESLRLAKARGDKLVVAVNSDSSVQRLKGPKRPVISLPERMEMLAALEFVDFVVSFEEDTPLGLVEIIRPDVLIKGADWEGKPVAGADLVKEVYFVPLIEDRSTTNLIEKIKTLLL